MLVYPNFAHIEVLGLIATDLNTYHPLRAEGRQGGYLLLVQQLSCISKEYDPQAGLHSEQFCCLIILQQHPARGARYPWWLVIRRTACQCAECCAQAPEGSPYGYLDSTQSPPQWAYDPNSELAATAGNPLANTLQQIYSGGVTYLIYK